MAACRSDGCREGEARWRWRIWHDGEVGRLNMVAARSWLIKIKTASALVFALGRRTGIMVSGGSDGSRQRSGDIQARQGGVYGPCEEPERQQRAHTQLKLTPTAYHNYNRSSPHLGDAFCRRCTG